MKEAKVTVIILNYNGKDDTLECLQSVYKIDYQNYDVIVVDNGSTDGSIDEIKAKFPNTILIESETNLGFCAANNLAVKHALKNDAEYLLALNNDAVVDPMIIKKLRKAADDNVNIACVNPLITDYDNRLKNQFVGIRIDFGNGDMFGQHKNENYLKEKRLLLTEAATWCVVFIKKTVIELVGFLDEDIFAYYEDVDWSFRAKKLGLKTVLIPEVLAYHKGSEASGGKYSPFVYYSLFRNKLIFMRKHAPIFRKVQFSVNYIKDSIKKYNQLLKEKKILEADSVIDGVWSAVKGYYGKSRISMPKEIKKKFSINVKIYLCLLTLRAVFFKRRCNENRN